jgi:hypothetical protein
MEGKKKKKGRAEEETYEEEALTLSLSLSLPQASHFKKPKLPINGFTIVHYAGDVAYDTTGFLEKNRDYIIPEQLSLLEHSPKLQTSLFQKAKEVLCFSFLFFFVFLRLLFSSLSLLSLLSSPSFLSFRSILSFLSFLFLSSFPSLGEAPVESVIHNRKQNRNERGYEGNTIKHVSAERCEEKEQKEPLCRTYIVRGREKIDTEIFLFRGPLPSKWSLSAVSSKPLLQTYIPVTSLFFSYHLSLSCS